jgi:hypothetical protein
MEAATTIVTPARFGQGLHYADFLAQATVNRDKFEQYYKDSPLTADDISFFKKAAALRTVRRKFSPWRRPGAATSTASSRP